MPAYVRRELLTAAQRAELLALPTDRLEIRERYSLTPADFDLINRHRTEANRLGFAIQLCLLCYPGRARLPAEQKEIAPLALKKRRNCPSFLNSQVEEWPILIATTCRLYVKSASSLLGKRCCSSRTSFHLEQPEKGYRRARALHLCAREEHWAGASL
jgi:Domain of unknown function (DUF4158)